MNHYQMAKQRFRNNEKMLDDSIAAVKAEDDERQARIKAAHAEKVAHV